MIRVLVTGATGFIGRPLCQALTEDGFVVRAALRTPARISQSVPETCVVGDITSTTDWSEALTGVDMVVHAAARVHVLRDALANEQLYAETNALGTRRLASAAAAAGVRRFLFLSSIKVNGEETWSAAYSAADSPDPQDAYGRSKWAAEQSLCEASATSSMQCVIVRPPLVYGPGVRANFLRLLQWVRAGRPLPLGSIDNARSLVSVWNLCDLLVRSLRHPAAAGGTWLVSDGEDVSTPELIRRIAASMGRRARLIPVPAGLLRLLGAASGRGAEVTRLCGSLRVDSEPTRRRLDWLPPLSLDQSLARTVDWFLGEYRGAGQ